MERLIAAGATVNERTPIVGSLDDDYTPLGIAAREGHVEIVRLLLDAGADPRQVVGLMKGTPVHEAALYGRADVIGALSFKEHRIDVPVGYSQFPRDIHETSRRWVEERYPTLVHYNELPEGGHFAAWEQPELFAQEVRASFRASRS